MLYGVWVTICLQFSLFLKLNVIDHFINATEKGKLRPIHEAMQWLIFKCSKRELKMFLFISFHLTSSRVWINISPKLRIEDYLLSVKQSWRHYANNPQSSTWGIYWFTPYYSHQIVSKFGNLPLLPEFVHICDTLIGNNPDIKVLNSRIKILIIFALSISIFNYSEPLITLTLFYDIPRIS